MISNMEKNGIIKKKLVGTIKKEDGIVKEIWTERYEDEKEYYEKEIKKIDDIKCPFCGAQYRTKYPISPESDKLKFLLHSLKNNIENLSKINEGIEQLKSK